MRKLFYARMALDNLRKNYRVYLPYLLTCTGTIMMFYILCALTFGDLIGSAGLRFGVETIKTMLYLGIYVVALFSVIFLFYTNSFLTKRRKKEFGLYNMLGMEKRHIARMMLYETLYSFVISLIAGLAGGILLSKLMALFVMRLLQADGGASFQVPGQAVWITVCLFGAIFLLTYLSALFTIHLSSPAQLLRGGQVGEKEPKTRFLLALMGVLLLGGGYYIAVVTTNPLEALLLFFVAVVLVILGTYCLFTAGSIALLKLLRKNKGYYYQTSHFISVSGMIYRMKQNAVGLANICILSTMVLVMLSSTISLYAGVKDSMNRQQPRQVTLSVAGDQDIAPLEAARDRTLEEEGAKMARPVSYRVLNVAAMQQGDHFIDDRSESGDNLFLLAIVPLEDLAGQLDNEETLAPGEAFIQVNQGRYDYDTLTAFGQTLTIQDKAALDFEPGSFLSGLGVGRITLVVDSMDTLRAFDEAQQKAYDSAASRVHTVCAFDVAGSDLQQEAVALRLSQNMQEGEVMSVSQLCRDGYQLFGSLFFLGLFLGALFIMATVLIMYYKQMSEGYDDRRRFQIMRSVGLDQGEIKRAIRSQVLTVFFLPLVMAAVHILFAFPMIVRMFSTLTMTNVNLFALTTAAALAIFALFYAAVYALTARTYYRIVSV